MSQSAECRAAFVPDGTEVTQNTTRHVLVLRACAFSYGWKRFDGGGQGEVTYIKKLLTENILLADYTD